MHAWDRDTKTVEILIAFSDPYQKCLRKTWKFLFRFFFPRPPPIEKFLVSCGSWRCFVIFRFVLQYPGEDSEADGG